MIVTLEPWHLLAVVMKAREEDLAAIDVTGEDRQRWACQRALASGLAFTVLDDLFQPVACFGFVDEMKGVSMAWLVAKPGWCRYVKSMARAFKLIVRDGGYRRIQAFVQPDRPSAKKFLLWLGFKLDGPLPKLGVDGSSMDLYSYT